MLGLAFLMIVSTVVGRYAAAASADPFAGMPATVMGVTSCAGGVVTSSVRLVGPLEAREMGVVHEARHTLQAARTGCDAFNDTSAGAVMLREADAGCATADFLMRTYHHRFDEFDFIAPTLAFEYDMAATFPPEIITAAADQACAPFRAKTAKH
jgi:hypothetical protein